jgi:hypothetical protein
MPNNSLVKVTLRPGECEAARVILNNYLQSGGGGVETGGRGLSFLVPLD